MSKLHNLILKAGNSGFYNWILNRVLSRAVPFNAPHNFRILKIVPGETTVLLPYKRSNMNHLKGIHACALATLCEYTIGLTLLSKISENNYRIILKGIRMEYHYQGKSDVVASFALPGEELKKYILGPLESSDAVFHEFQIAVYDTQKNHICTGWVNWQVKKWDKVTISRN